ncbi:restriction endonuclease subunit S [Vibrio tasmaniensis]|uniref:restriction endonuclease subunit S n=1 Tax=Vibrio tasmaniensis TaxID=212663 RepID=UPI00069714C3|nr:restriction endonuclease subunit S [Vibrio tasmaniensis]
MASLKEINWNYGVLDDVVSKGSSNISLNKIKDDKGEFPVFGAKGYMKSVSFFQQENDYLAIVKDGAGIGRVTEHPAKSSVLATMQYLIPKEGFELRFIKYCLESIDFSEYKTGSTIPHIYFKDYKSAPVPLPPIPEQKRIVTLLDTVFADLEHTRAKTEQNLKNARELFDSYLRGLFNQTGENWKSTTVGEQLTLQRGIDITKKMQKPGTIPVVSSGGIKSYHDTSKADGPGVVIGRKGSLGTVYYLDENYWPHDTTLWVKDFKGNEPKFIYYLFLGLDVKHLDSGSANPALNRNLVHPIKISWPEISKQKQLISKLDLLLSQVNELEEIYKIKLSHLNELKKSILQKAFSGELTHK